MAKTKTSFSKNDPRINRKGAPKIDGLIKHLRELNREEITLNFSEMLRMVKPEIQAVIQNPKTCIKDLGIAKAILKWLESGDFRYIQPYIEYIFGKPKETIALKGSGLIIQLVSFNKKGENDDNHTDTGS